MATKTEAMARRIVREMQACTRGKSRKWVPVHTLALRLVMKKNHSLALALTFGVDRGWLLVEGGHSVCLTDTGRRRAQV